MSKEVPMTVRAAPNHAKGTGIFFVTSDWSGNSKTGVVAESIETIPVSPLARA